MWKHPNHNPEHIPHTNAHLSPTQRDVPAMAQIINSEIPPVISWVKASCVLCNHLWHVSCHVAHGWFLFSDIDMQMKPQMIPHNTLTTPAPYTMLPFFVTADAAWKIWSCWNVSQPEDFSQLHINHDEHVSVALRLIAKRHLKRKTRAPFS